jgi:hypothetical protein
MISYTWRISRKVSVCFTPRHWAWQVSHVPSVSVYVIPNCQLNFCHSIFINCEGLHCEWKGETHTRKPSWISPTQLSADQVSH